MHRSIKVALAAGIIAAAIAPSVGAHYAKQACNGVVSTYVTPAGTIYTDDRGDGTPVPVNVPGVEEFWIYLETNNHPGLQTGGDHAVLGAAPGFVDDCKDTAHGSAAKDSILF